ncbi:hypothetical protein Bca52824_007679 [Brassica carinata]|uniref:Uncharacterized protein n=1 Tax=Brassica carinata TaxID=52824 RepID=A0A8X7W7J4_BRACI|nr:hypothetical protein Bca52824_007679 [Brassica carinata]
MSSSTEATARLAMEAQISLSAFRAPPLGICSSHVSYSDGDFPAEWSSGAWDSLWLGVSSEMSHVAYAQEVSTVGVWSLARSSSTELETVLRRVLPLVLRGGTWASLNGAPLGHLECLSLGSSCVECNIPALDGVFVQVMTFVLSFNVVAFQPDLYIVFGSVELGYSLTLGSRFNCLRISLGSCHEASSDFAGFVLRIGVVDLCWVRVESFGSKRRRGIRVRTLKHRRKSRVRA